MNFILFAALAGVFSFFIGHFPGWFDSGEFAVATDHLGISHPTGHPFYILAAKPFTLLPFGSIAFRTSLFSLLSTLFCVWFIKRILHKYLGSTFIAYLIALLFLFHPTVGLQMTRTEVYAPQLALMFIVVGCFFRFLETEDSRLFLLGTFAFGLASTLQPLLTVTLAPIFFIPLFTKSGMRIKWGTIGILFVLIGMVVDLYLPIRGLANPVVNWDHPITLRRFWAALMAYDFREFFHSPLSSKAKVDFLKGEIFQIIPLSLFLASLIGAAVLWKKSKKEACFFLLLLFSSSSSWLLKEFHLVNPDAHAYVLMPLVIALILGTIGLVRIAQFLPLTKNIRSPLVILTLVLLFGKLLFLGPYAWNAHAAIDAEKLSRHLDYAPPNSTLYLGSDHWLFPIWYRTYVENRRPDVKIVGMGMIKANWYQTQLNERYGAAPRSLKWHELGEPMLGIADWGKPARHAFWKTCSELTEKDPFQIRRAICAQTVLSSSQQMGATSKPSHEIIQYLENYFQLPESHFTCVKASPVGLPFPLMRDEKEAFLVDPSRPRLDLILLYMGCGHPELALKVAANPIDSGNPDIAALSDYLQRQSVK